MKVGIIDYNAGNLRSVDLALKHLGLDAFVSDKPRELEKADRLVFPGDGHAATSMQNLKERGLDELLVQFFQRGRPILGICVGSQIVLESSDETVLGQTEPTRCLGLVQGACHRLDGHSSLGTLKVPHMGWNAVHFPNPSHPLLLGIPSGTDFYFVHSYYTEVTERSTILGRTEYGKEFTTGFVKDALAAWQFHPEKSGEWGLKLVANFFQWRP